MKSGSGSKPASSEMARTALENPSADSSNGHTSTPSSVVPSSLSGGTAIAGEVGSWEARGGRPQKGWQARPKRLGMLAAETAAPPNKLGVSSGGGRGFCAGERWAVTPPTRRLAAAGDY